MPKPYDATSKFLVGEFLLDWLKFSPFPDARQVEVIDADLSTVTAQADKVLRVSDPTPWIFHVELQANRDDGLAERVHWYNALLEYRHRLPVFSLVVLLRKEADNPGLTGEHQRNLPGRPAYRWFRYDVLRVWQHSADEFLAAGLGLTPLAALTDDARTRLPSVLVAVEKRIELAPDRRVADTLWRAVDVLLELRYSNAEIVQMIEKILQLGEPTALEFVMRKREMKALRATLMRLAEKKFGAPSEDARRTVETVDDQEQLAGWFDKVLVADSWEQMLNGAGLDQPAT